MFISTLFRSHIGVAIVSLDDFDPVLGLKLPIREQTFRSLTRRIIQPGVTLGLLLGRFLQLHDLLDSGTVEISGLSTLARFGSIDLLSSL